MHAHMRLSFRESPCAHARTHEALFQREPMRTWAIHPVKSLCRERSNCSSLVLLRLPWFRVHIVILNDPGRLISVHLMHTALVSGWSGVMMLYELVVVDPSDPVLNPIWRQGCYVLAFVSRLGVSSSIFHWSLGLILASNHLSLSYETVSQAHIFFSGFCMLASFWHWASWDLDIFLVQRNQLLDFLRILGNLVITSLLCTFFGFAHLTGLYGPGMWTSDSCGIFGSTRDI